VSAEFTKVALEFIEQVVDLDDDAAVCDLLLARARDLGFENMVVCDLPASGRPAKFVATWPTAFRERYLAALYRDDPLARHARGTAEPFAWSEATWDRTPRSREQRVIEEAAEFGLEDGFVVPVIGIGADQSAIGLSGRRIRLDAGDRRGLHMMSIFAHYAIWRRRDAIRRMSPPHSLTEPQREALRYAVFGNQNYFPHRFSAGEMCEISHSVCARFGARNIMEAGCLAFMRGELNP
jgi:LuxR family quorum sensing-dependent transcriptional regulator